MLPVHRNLFVSVLYTILLCAAPISAVPAEVVTDPPTAIIVEGSGQEPTLVFPTGAAYYLEPLISSAESNAANHVPIAVPTETAALVAAESAAVEVGTVNSFDEKQTVTVVEMDNETRIYLYDPTAVQPGMEPWQSHLNLVGTTTSHGVSTGPFPTVGPVEVIYHEPLASEPAENVMEPPTTAVPIEFTAQEQPAMIPARVTYHLEPLTASPVEPTATNPERATVLTEAVTVESTDTAIGEASVLAVSARIGEENVNVPLTVEVVETLDSNNKKQTVTVVEMNDETRIYLYDPASIQPGTEPWNTHHLNSADATTIQEVSSVPPSIVVPVEAISDEPPALIPAEAIVEPPIAAVPVEVIAKEPSVVMPAEATSVEVPMIPSPSEPTATNPVPVVVLAEAASVDEGVTDVQQALEVGTVSSFNKKQTSVTVVEMNDETRIYVYDPASVEPGMEPWKTNINWGVATIYGGSPLMVPFPTRAPVGVPSEDPLPAAVTTDAAFVEPLVASEPLVPSVQVEAFAVEPADTKEATTLTSTRTDEGVKFNVQATLEMRTVNKKKHTVKVIETDDQTLIFVYDPKSIRPGMEPWRNIL